LAAAVRIGCNGYALTPDLASGGGVVVEHDDLAAVRCGGGGGGHARGSGTNDEHISVPW
jgi:hypothetical protein